MQKHVKLLILAAVSWGLFVYWAVLIAMGIRDEMISYWWQAFLAAASLLFAVFGFMSAKGWHWTKSSMGKSVLAMSIGLLMWGLGQAEWTFEVIKNPEVQSPPGHLLDVLYSSAMIFWAYGIIMLARATGAKYGIRSNKTRLLAAIIVLVLWLLSYVILVDVVRGGMEYFQSNDRSFWAKFFDLSYAAGDVINLTMAAVIFAASWKFLGGIFKKPIIVMLSAFFLLYMSDFWFSYRDGQGVYYNGDWVDLLFLLTVTAFGLGLCLLDPSNYRMGKLAASSPVLRDELTDLFNDTGPISSTERLKPSLSTAPANITIEQATAGNQPPAEAVPAVTEPPSTEPMATATEAPAEINPVPEPDATAATTTQRGQE